MGGPGAKSRLIERTPTCQKLASRGDARALPENVSA